MQEFTIFYESESGNYKTTALSALMIDSALNDFMDNYEYSKVYGIMKT